MEDWEKLTRVMNYLATSHDETTRGWYFNGYVIVRKVRNGILMGFSDELIRAFVHDYWITGGVPSVSSALKKG